MFEIKIVQIFKKSNLKILKLKKAQIQKKNKFSKVQKKPIGKIKKTGEKKPTEPYKKPVENEKTEEKKRRKTNSVATGPAQLDPALSGAIARSRVERRIGLGGNFPLRLISPS
jgi:hypothetical protein